MFKIILFLIVIGCIVMMALPIIKTFKRRRAEAKLRENPPEQIRFVVRLPHDADKSNTKMIRFWDRLHRQLPDDPKLLLTGENTIHMAMVGEGTGAGKAPKVKFVVWCSPLLEERVQIALSECYDSEAEITTMDPEDDPLWNYAEAVRAKRAWEQHRMALEAQAKLAASRAAQASSDDDDDDDDDDE